MTIYTEPIKTHPCVADGCNQTATTTVHETAGMHEKMLGRVCDTHLTEFIETGNPGASDPTSPNAPSVNQLAEFVREHSLRWLPQQADSDPDLLLARTLNGAFSELGEVANAVRKRDEYTAEQQHGKVNDIADELADTLFYLMNLVVMLDVDIDAAIRRIVEKNEARWGTSIQSTPPL